MGFSQCPVAETVAGGSFGEGITFQGTEGDHEWRNTSVQIICLVQKNCEACLRTRAPTGIGRETPDIFLSVFRLLAHHGTLRPGQGSGSLGPKYQKVASCAVPTDKRGAPVPQGVSGIHLPQQGRGTEDKRTGSTDCQKVLYCTAGGLRLI